MPHLYDASKDGEVPKVTEISPQELVDRYDLVEVRGTHAIVAPRGDKKLAEPDRPDLSELGSSSPSPFLGWMRQEYNPELRGQAGMRKYDEMRRADSTVRSSLLLAKTPVLGARWFVEPGTGSSDPTKRDINVADFIWANLNNMSIGFTQFMSEALLMLDFGYYMFEKVFDDTNTEPWARGKVIWRKLAPRHPMDVIRWESDKNGGPSAVVMASDQPPNYEVTIPIDKLLVFTYCREGGDMAGISVLRSAYKHWYYKDQLYKIDAIQKERHGIGIPVIKLPPGFSPTDKALAEEMGRNLRTNERSHITLPPLWDIMMLKLEGQPVDALKSAEHHDKLILRNVLTEFILNASAKADEQTLFLKAIRYVADLVEETINLHAVKQLVDFNYQRVKYPNLRARRIGEQADWRTLSFAIRNFIGANVIEPDDPLEGLIRSEMDLPIKDPESVRKPQTPQTPQAKAPTTDGRIPAQPNPPRVGPPRQSPNAPVGPPGRGAGRDTSGGK